ncbi:MAG: hypothetical protein QGG36_33070 [Pirellulaceae bacterium]|nr:hypothetical protein [Pirellulaceae bacterium]
MDNWAKTLWNAALDGEHQAVVHAPTAQEAVARAAEILGIGDESRVSVSLFGSHPKTTSDD